MLVTRVDIPAFDWPVAPFPHVSYPLAKNKEANAAEVERCLAEVHGSLKGVFYRQLYRFQQVENILKNNPVPVAAAIVEPVSS